MINIEYLEKELNSIGLTPSQKQLDQFILYYKMLIEWNNRFNLTAITNFEQVVLKHYIDSVSLIQVDKNFNEYNKIIDVGTGAGFPAIPIKILFPNLDFTLLDSLKKRVNFLQEVINRLQLKSIVAIHGRAEDIASSKEHRENYDLCISRAVANLATLLEYCLPFVKVSGNFIAYKSINCNKEIEGSKNVINILGGTLSEIIEYQLPNTDIKRILIKINKINNTNKKYPRKAGKPSKEPLK